jgi:hypothetical protein
MQKLFLLTLSAGIILMTSCKKNADELGTPPLNSTELKANAAFGWRTYRNVAVTVTGTPVTGSVTGKFLIELENGQKVYEALHDMKLNYNFTLNIPAHVTKLVYKFGNNFTKEVDLTGSSVVMNYLVDTDNGYVP